MGDNAFDPLYLSKREALKQLILGDLARPKVTSLMSTCCCA
jgi:hypothetical protein